METSLWAFMIIGGPILLGLVLIYAVIKNKTSRGRQPESVTEQATRDLRDRLNREDQRGGS
jgi:hypothetical protein